MQKKSFHRAADTLLAYASIYSIAVSILPVPSAPFL